MQLPSHMAVPEKPLKFRKPLKCIAWVTLFLNPSIIVQQEQAECFVESVYVSSCTVAITFSASCTSRISDN